MSAETPLILRYRLTPADYNAFIGAVRWTALERATRATWVVGLIATAAIAGSVIWNVLGQRYPAVPVVTGVVVTTAACLVGIGGLYWLLLYPSYLRSVFSGQVMAAGEMELSIDSASMTSKVGSERTTVAWPGVTVVNRPRHYFLFYSRFNAIILPKRAFTGEPDHTHFTRLIEGHAKLMSPQ